MAIKDFQPFRYVTMDPEAREGIATLTEMLGNLAAMTADFTTEVCDRLPALEQEISEMRSLITTLTQRIEALTDQCAESIPPVQDLHHNHEPAAGIPFFSR